MEADDLLAALDAVAAGVWIWDAATGVLRWSPALLRLLGRDPDGPAPTYESYVELVHADDRAAFLAAVTGAMERARATGRSADYHLEHRVAVAPGSYRWIDARGKTRMAGSEPVGMLGTVVDVTDKRAATAALVQAEEASKLFAELASDYIYSVDLEADPPAMSVLAGSFERTTGMVLDEIASRGGWPAVIHHEDRAQAVEEYMPALLQGRPMMLEYRVVSSTGETRWLRDHCRPMTTASGRVSRLVGGVQDITVQKRLGEELVQARKQEALGRLSGAVAHDFNNLLTVMTVSLDMLERRHLDPEVCQVLSTVRAAAAHAADLTRSLLIFGRGNVGVARTVDVNRLVREALPMIERAVGESVKVELAL
jgi:two-component system, cell cycle sensor histidine kinase and response regulator CckA